MSEFEKARDEACELRKKEDIQRLESYHQYPEVFMSTVTYGDLAQWCKEAREVGWDQARQWFLNNFDLGDLHKLQKDKLTSLRNEFQSLLRHSVNQKDKINALETKIIVLRETLEECLDCADCCPINHCETCDERAEKALAETNKEYDEPSN